jgi:hypothetical protein
MNHHNIYIFTLVLCGIWAYKNPHPNPRTVHIKQLRALWYFLHVGLEEEDTQKYGIIMLAYPHDLVSTSYTSSTTTTSSTTSPSRPSSSTPSSSFSSSSSSSSHTLNRKLGYHGAKLLRAIPIRVEGLHICSDKVATVFAMKLTLMAASRDIRLRTRCHCGT